MAISSEEILLRMGFDASAVKNGTAAMLSNQKTAANSVKEMWSGIGQHIAGVLGGAAILGAFEKQAENAKKILAGASKTGLDARSYQSLSQVAQEDLPDGAEKFDAAITKLNVNLGKGTKEFEKWGIHSKDAQGAIYEIADRMQAMTDPAQKAAMAVELMGKGGAALVPFLERGAAALKTMADEQTIYTAEELKSLANTQKRIEKAEKKVGVASGKVFATLVEEAEMVGMMGSNNTVNDEGGTTKHITTEQLIAFARQAAANKEGKAAAADAEKKAEAEKKVADSAAAAAASAKRKAESEKLTEVALEKQNKFNREYDKLQRSEAKLEHEANMVERETPTMEDLAGRDYTGNLNKLYGKGGQYDLAKGDGPFAGVAQDYELAQKQQQWDIIHGNAQFDAQGNLTGGAAAEDRQRMIRDKNMLGGAGMETDAMKFADMKEHLSDIRQACQDLFKKASGEGINIADSSK
jgi:hypothetical protein